MKKKLLVSFSGGETSAYMAQWLWSNKQDEYEMIFVFANTGQENEETLDFIRRFEIHYKIKVVWIEALVFHGQRKGNGFRIVNYETASRNGEPFEEIIKKHGIPNQATPHCTRELKRTPIESYARSLGWKSYFTAIGIRSDEADRINFGAKEKRKLYYPLATNNNGIAVKKSDINAWWDVQPFRLDLKGYQGNCMTCWKKSNPKLMQVAKENQRAFSFFYKMEQKYGDFVPESRLLSMQKRGVEPNLPVTFFRNKKSTMDIIEMSKQDFKEPIDDSLNIDLDGGSCEIWSQCGD